MATEIALEIDVHPTDPEPPRTIAPREVVMVAPRDDRLEREVVELCIPARNSLTPAAEVREDGRQR